MTSARGGSCRRDLVRRSPARPDWPELASSRDGRPRVIEWLDGIYLARQTGPELLDPRRFMDVFGWVVADIGAGSGGVAKRGWQWS